MDRSEGGDVLAYIGYLHLEGMVGPTSVSQYVTAVFRYHELLNFNPPTDTLLESALVRGYGHKSDLQRVVYMARVGLPAGLMC